MASDPDSPLFDAGDTLSGRFLCLAIMNASPNSSVRFVAYIDESGDPGLTNVKPIDPNGASEWLVVSCFLVRFDNDTKVLGWVREIISKFKNVQSPYLHFSDLIPVKKRLACSILADKPCRCFVVMSNKKNMRGYENRNIRDSSKAWFYWWLMRLLLEKVTDFCEQRIAPEDRGRHKLRIIFSRRGGLRYADCERYLRKLRGQSRAGLLTIDTGDLCWSVIDFDELLVLDHKDRAGLQLADIVSGAFFQAVERQRPGDCDATYAKLLKSRMALDRYSRILGYSIKTMPELSQMGLTPPQREVFEFYGYSREGW